MEKKNWSNPQVRSLNSKFTFTFEVDVEPFKSEASCGGTYAEAANNQGKGCSVTSCGSYVLNNNGKPGEGGKCGGPKVPMS